MKSKILLLAAITLSACAQHAPVESSAAAPKSTAVPISEMDPGFLYLAAQNALNQGNTDLAIRLLQALVAKDPEAVKPRIQLVELLLGRGQPAAAGKVIDELLAHKDLEASKRDEVMLLHARYLAVTGKPEEALVSLQKYLDHHPTDADARRLQAQLLVSVNRLKEAQAAIDKAIRAGDSADLRLIQAQLFMQDHNLAGAKEALKQMRKLAPDDDTPVLMLSQIALQQKQPEVAESLLRDFLASHRDAWRVSNALGRILVQQGRIDDAIVVYRDLVNRTGGEPEIVKALGLLYLQQRNYKEAEAAFARIEGSSDEATFYHGISLEGLERIDEARKQYAGIGKQSPLYTESQLRLAGLDAHDQQWDKAASRLLDLLQVRPDTADAYEMLSAIRVQQKKYELLLKESEPALALPKPPTGVLFNRAVAYNALKQHDKEESTLHLLLHINPNHPEALNFLGYSLADRGIRLDEAEKLIRRALELKPDDAYFQDSLAWVYFKQGKFAEAAKIQEKAIAGVKNDPTMLEHMGDIYWRLNRLEAARDAWQRALKNNPDDPALLKQKIKQGL
ncbi:MAG TPA: tetratricopeptide repeat protein [Mariprofundaceae bacterium]|nr:tetratricopeptide repeat protein [Mariprofundaceae bacterium]